MEMEDQTPTPYFGAFINHYINTSIHCLYIYYRVETA